MRFEGFSFGSIRIDGVSYDHDVVIDRGEVRKRKKKASKKFREAFGHTPLSLEEEIPWKCRRLVVGTGTGALPVMKEVQADAKRRNIELLILPTSEAIEILKTEADATNAILHDVLKCRQLGFGLIGECGTMEVQRGESHSSSTPHCHLVRSGYTDSSVPLHYYLI